MPPLPCLLRLGVVGLTHCETRSGDRWMWCGSRASCPRRTLSRGFTLRACRSGLVPRKTQSLLKSCRRSALESSQSRAGRCQHPVTGKLTLGFPSLKVGGEEPGRPVPLIFFACKTGSLDAGRMVQGLPDCLDFRSPDVLGRMWLSLGEIIAPPGPA